MGLYYIDFDLPSCRRERAVSISVANLSGSTPVQRASVCLYFSPTVVLPQDSVSPTHHAAVKREHRRTLQLFMVRSKILFTNILREKSCAVNFIRLIVRLRCTRRHIVLQIVVIGILQSLCQTSLRNSDGATFVGKRELSTGLNIKKTP